MSSIQTLSPGGEPQLGRSRFSSPIMAMFIVAHEGTHPIHVPPPPMVAPWIMAEKGLSRGRCPVSGFPLMEKSVKLPMFLTHNGNSPDSRLFARSSAWRLESCPSSGGIDPVSLLLWMYSHWRLDRFLISFGIGPVSPLLWSCRCVRLGRFPSSGGSVPFSPQEARISRVTR